MPRQPSRRDLVRQLLAVSREEGDAQEFEGFLRDHSAQLQAALTVSAAELRSLASGSAVERAKGVRDLVREAAARQSQARADQNQNLALAAATMIAELAKWHEDHFVLDPRIVLGNLLVDSTKMAVRFDAEKLGKVVVLRTKLKEVKRELKFSDLECFVDQEGLNFRWRAGVGRLLLTSQDLPRKDKHSFVPVVLTRTRRKGVQLNLTSGSQWAARALSDIAFA